MSRTVIAKSAPEPVRINDGDIIRWKHSGDCLWICVGVYVEEGIRIIAMNSLPVDDGSSAYRTRPESELTLVRRKHCREVEGEMSQYNCKNLKLD